MKHKLIGKVWRKDPGKKVWYDIVCTSSDPVEVGDNLIIQEYLSEDMDELIVRPSTGTCSSDCWAHCHIESNICRHVFKCAPNHLRVCLVHIGAVLEDL